jgi:glycosyltransferase involved in cell wall biosynthesis
MISAIILTHNDENSIRSVLDTVKWCDEKIVIDDISTDKTRTIAKSMGATVFEHSLNDDFAAQRDFGLDKARGEWVLFVDSDELVPSKLRDEILSLPKDDKHCGYYILRKDFLFGRELKYGETTNVKLLRLAKKSAGVWVRSVHETWDIRGPVASLTTPLFHYPHATVSEFLAQINRYTTINAKVFYDEGTRISVCQIILYPVGKFIQNYVIRLGFLDGIAGLIMAVMMSFHSFLTRGKLWELQQKEM